MANAFVVLNNVSIAGVEQMDLQCTAHITGTDVEGEYMQYEFSVSVSPADTLQNMQTKVGSALRTAVMPITIPSGRAFLPAFAKS